MDEKRMKLNLASPVGILGFGVEGKSTLDYLVRNGIQDIVIMDKNPVELPALSSNVKVKTFSGENYMDGLKDCVTVVRSAGVYPMQQELFHFQMNGGVMTSQIEIFLSENHSKSVVGVTGTLGKGSTVSMIRHALNACKIPCVIGGNFGVPALDLLKDDSPDRISILELSSFQLMTLPMSPHVGVVLRVSTEHLDWHKSVEEYRDAKANLVRWQKRSDYCVYIQDAAPSAAIARESGAKKLAYGSQNAEAIFTSDSLLGGSEKNADFTELSTLLATLSNLKRVSLIGATAERMLDSLKRAGVSVPMQIFPGLDEAFSDACSLGKGCAVLLSPACASFGLFKNYKVRGQCFDALVEKF